MIKITVSVISDLVTDQRVHKVSQTLHNLGYEVLLVGTKKATSLELQQRPYQTRRIKVIFQKGFLFYAEWNTRLFFFLLFNKSKVLLANDLDTLAPNYFISRLRNKVLVYDTHEFFTETAELYQRSLVKNVWTKIENFLLPRVKYMYTVNNSVAELYNAKFKKKILVVRNVPLVKQENNSNKPGYNLPPQLDGKKILLMQGSGLNENRGLEELVMTMQLLGNEFMLVIAGSGLIIQRLKQMATDKGLQEKVFFTGILPFEELHLLTQKAYAGFTLDKPLNINQQASLPNKLFDYLASNVPVIASNIKEVAAIIHQYKAGIVIDEVTPQKIAAAVNGMAANDMAYDTYKKNTALAMNDLNWNKEQQIIEQLFSRIMKENKLAIG